MLNSARLSLLCSSLIMFTRIFITETAAAADITGTLQGTGYTIMSISDDVVDTSSSSPFTLSPTGTTARLYLVDSTGSLAGPVIAAVKYKRKYYSYNSAKRNRICHKPEARLVMGLKPGANLAVGTVKVNSTDGIGYLASRPSKTKLDRAALATIDVKSRCLPAGTGTSLGLGETAAAAAITPIIRAVEGDEDKDGLLDVLDIDRDNDGILNAYDSEAIAPPSATSFNVFSNLKLEIDRSLNQYIQTVTTGDLSTASQSVTLAMQLAGSTGDVVELNCGSLGYCSTGGTGQYNSLSFPDSYDGDADGFGTMTKGPTNDFQLQTRANPYTAIASGDMFVEIVSTGGTAVEVPGMLNFVFRTTPAVQSLVMGASTITPTYPPSNGMAGSANNPFSAPGGWDGVLTLTAYRPQREGISGAGEGTFVDVGKSIVTIDIPNAPCATATSGGCPGTGPGNCANSTYSETDSNLATDTAGRLVDTRDDQDTDTADAASNRVTFSVNLTNCLTASAITWNSGQKLAVDLQFRNEAGDNAAQKFYIAKP